MVTGITGVGKTYLACAFAHKACLENFRIQYHRLFRLLEEVQIIFADGEARKFLKKLAVLDVLVIDGWGIGRITPEQQHHLLEILDDRYQRRSAIATSQYP